MVKRLREMIIKIPQRNIVSLKHWFFREKVSMIGQSFALFQFNYLICLCIFGKEFCKFRSAKLVYQSKRVTMIRISIIDTVKEPLTVSGIC